MGRPKKKVDEDPKNCNIHIRATKSQMDFLEMLSYESEKSKTDIIWRALEFWHNCNKASF